MISEKEHDIRLSCYRKGLNDSQIAREVGSSAECIRSWRRRNGLPPNFEIKKKPIPKRAKKLVTFCCFCNFGTPDGNLIHCEELDIWMKKIDFCSYGEVSP